jgi:tRNA dimethylallyltransferase
VSIRRESVRRVAIVGPTASGKSAVAMAAARAVPGTELVSIDAMQVYRGMDIGTAKPTIAERAAVRHHLLDLVDPGEEFTVAEFQHAYDEALTEIAERGGRALLVGGTGLYHRAVVDELTIPGEWPDVRSRLEADLATSGVTALHARLVTLDPLAASRMEPTNERRVLRALEVCLGSGRPFSAFGPGLDTYPASPVVQIGLRWRRDVLAARIARRVEQMMADGLLAEVEALANREGGLSRTAAQALGYRELLDHLAGRSSLDEAVALVVTRTRQYAVRQERWFRRDPRLRWIEISTDAVAEAAPAVVEALR